MAFSPTLGRWKEVLTAEEAGHPLWEDISTSDCNAFLHALSQPSSERKGMEGIVAAAVTAARRTAAALSFRRGGTSAPLFDVGTMFQLAPSATFSMHKPRREFV
eukprot:TRINITY_DN18358_c0_g1_i1.p8 TRINITY_DN18358_c0_g1~~TRINITY_DN18358_c0_g1_i1.p8  ORF type:complete len:104 (-),score=14.08 TRINITY_DN18358_c0_g1_i1:1869-2180(-)